MHTYTFLSGLSPCRAAAERERVLSIRIEEVEDDTGLPVIATNVTIFSDLTFKAHSRGVPVPPKKTTDITSRNSKLSTVTETLNILARLKSSDATPEDEAEAAASILDSLSQYQDSDVAPVKILTDKVGKGVM